MSSPRAWSCGVEAEHPGRFGFGRDSEPEPCAGVQNCPPPPPASETPCLTSQRASEEPHREPIHRGPSRPPTPAFHTLAECRPVDRLVLTLISVRGNALQTGRWSIILRCFFRATQERETQDLSVLIPSRSLKTIANKTKIPLTS